MAGIDTYLACWMCRHFDGDAQQATARACKLHDFVQPRGATVVCRDLDCIHGDEPELALLEPHERGTLLYHGAPYAPSIYRLGRFEELQKRMFVVTFVAGQHFDKHAEFPEFVFPLGLIGMQWKQFPEGEVRLDIGGEVFPARITRATDIRNRDTQPILHSAAALPRLKAWSGLDEVKAKLEAMKAPFMGYEAFLECADDLSVFRFIRNEISAHMPEDLQAMMEIARQLRAR